MKKETKEVFIKALRMILDELQKDEIYEIELKKHLENLKCDSIATGYTTVVPAETHGHTFTIEGAIDSDLKKHPVPTIASWDEVYKGTGMSPSVASESTSLYYTPSPDEFCTGFEYEYKDNHTGEWRKMEFDITTDWVPREGVESRVKKLDKEDIESLGWKHDSDEFYNFSYRYQMLFMDGRMTIYLKMHKQGGERADIAVFNGAIKNKTELKKLMDQIGINVN